MTALASDAPPGKGRLAVFYDGGCPICSREIAHYRRIDRAGALDLRDVSGEGPSRVCGLDRAALLAAMHVMAPDGTVHRGAAAFREIWLRLPAPWRLLGALLRVPGMTPAAELFYRAWLRLRLAAGRRA